MEEKIYKMPIILSPENSESLQTEIEKLFLYLDLTQFIAEKLKNKKPIKQITFEENGQLLQLMMIWVQKYFLKIILIKNNQFQF